MPFNREISIEQRDEIVGTDVVGGVKLPRLHVLAMLVVEVVVHGEQYPTRTYRIEQRPHRGFTGGLR